MVSKPKFWCLAIVYVKGVPTATIMPTKGMYQDDIKGMVEELLEAKLGEFKHSKGEEKGYECGIDGEEVKVEKRPQGKW